ncbi:MAG: hypothetical protein ACTIJ6_00020 [Leucobacter sp.]
MGNGEQDLVNTAREAITSAQRQLREAGVQPEALAEFVPERRVLFVKRPATMTPLGEVWRLGTLLLSAESVRMPGDARASTHQQSVLYAARHTTRAAVRLHRGNQSISREERRDIAAAALAGGYAAGTTVHFDAQPIFLEPHVLRELSPEYPLGVAEGELRVRWRAGAPLDGAPAFSEYLAERVSLLTDPPDGA